MKKKIDYTVAITLITMGFIHNSFAVMMTVGFLPGCPIAGSSRFDACYDQLGVEEMWFIGTGVMLWAVGTLNVLRIRYAEIASGLKTGAIIINAVTVTFMVLLRHAFPFPRYKQVWFAIFVTGTLLVMAILQETTKAPAMAPPEPRTT
jgi:hypothetical protein